MTWYARLARWQRLGIVLSISWAIFAGLHQHYEDAEQATTSAKFAYDVCVEGQKIARSADFKECELQRD